MPVSPSYPVLCFKVVASQRFLGGCIHQPAWAGFYVEEIARTHTHTHTDIILHCRRAKSLPSHVQYPLLSIHGGNTLAKLNIPVFIPSQCRSNVNHTEFFSKVFKTSSCVVHVLFDLTTI